MEPRPAGKAGREICGPGQARGGHGIHPGQLGQEKQKEGEACHRVTLRRRCGAPSIFFHRLWEREIHCEGHMAGCTLVSQFGRLADMKEQMESVCQKNYEACAIYRMVMAEKYGGDEACRA